MSRQTWGIIGVIVLVFVAIFLFAFVKGPSGTIPGGGGTGSEAEPPGPVTREAPPKNVVVPGAGAENVPENVAVPQSVSPTAAHRGGAQNRSFEVQISGNKFEPDTVIVNKGDTVRISVTAVDKNYDYFQPDYGFKIVLKKGESNFTQFDATAAGRFTIFCESCGGPEKGPIGYLVVAEK